MLDGNQMFQMSINDKRFLVTWNSLLKVLNGNAVFESTISLLNVVIYETLVIWDLLNETLLCRLHNKMSFPAASDIHAKLYLEEILVGLFEVKFSIQKCTTSW